jgi:hypothetical protein
VVGVLFPIACAAKDDTDTEEQRPQSCLPISPGEDPHADSLRDDCYHYWSVISCCTNVEPYGSMEGGEPSGPCLDAANRDEGCRDIIATVLSCVVDTAGSSCEDVQTFWAATYGSGEREPPTDPAAPCYEEVRASWDAGCNWPPY